MQNALMHNVGGAVKLTAGVAPVDTAAATLAGLAIDRDGYNSAVFHTRVGAASGTPDSYTVAATITHCATSGGSYEAFKPDGTNTATMTTLTADNTETQLDIDLIGAMRYLKVAIVVTFVGGSTPKIEVANTCCLGGATSLPAA